MIPERIALASVTGEAAWGPFAALGPSCVFARDDQMGGAKGLAIAPALLLVEDDFLLAATAESALRDAGFDVREVATSAEEALNAASSTPFTLAVMDIRLATRKDGIECAIELWKRHGLRSIFATAHYDDQTRRRAEPAQPLAWLHKPYTMTSLVLAVSNAVDQLGEEQ